MASPSPVPPNRRVIETIGLMEGLEQMLHLQGAHADPVSRTEKRTTSAPVPSSTGGCQSRPRPGSEFHRIAGGLIRTCPVARDRP